MWWFITLMWLDRQVHNVLDLFGQPMPRGKDFNKIMKEHYVYKVGR